MRREVVTASPAASIGAVARLMLEHGVGSVLIVDPEDPDHVAGIVTKNDLTPALQRVPRSSPSVHAARVIGRWVQSARDLGRAYHQVRDVPVEEVMSRPVLVVEEGADVWQAAELMLEHDINRLPVVRGGRLVGIVARHDLLHGLVADHETG